MPTSRFSVVLLIGLMTLNTCMLGWGAWCHSPTVDEIAYLPAGLWHWSTGRFELACVSPPLVRLVAAAPLLLADPQTDWTSVAVTPGRRSEHRIGKNFLRANGPQSFWYFTVARWACIPFSLLGVYVCWRWASELYGESAGLLAALLWSISPNLLAHGQLMTPDVGLTATLVTACFLFWRWLRRPGWTLALVCGLALGVAQLSKTTAVVLFPVYLLVWCVVSLLQRNARGHSWSKQELLQLGTIFFVAIMCINLGYGYAGSFRRLDQYAFVSHALGGDDAVSGRMGNRFNGSWLGIVPVPFPADYLLGIDFQWHDFDSKLRSYLGGEFKQGGWWYYYLYGLAIKVPLGTWLLLVLAEWARLRSVDKLGDFRNDIVVIAPASAILILVSSQTGFSHHVRYVLPIAPFAFVWISKIAQPGALGSRWLSLVAVTAIVWTSTSSLFVYPHSMSYFNELVSGPRGGHAHLINSNIDWGQDLLYLQEWVRDNPQARPLKVAFYGGYDPHLAGIKFSLPPSSGPSTCAGASPALDAGWYAVSVNFLRGHHYVVINERGETESTEDYCWKYFLAMKPVAMAGYSIYIYRVNATDKAHR